MPLYNEENFVERTVRSVLLQTIQDFEIIIVDGGSTDKSVEIVKNIPDTRIFVIQQKGNGIADARNEGIYASNSDLIAFLDADDEWMPDFLETIIDLKNKFPNAGAFSTAFVRHGMNGEITYPRYKGIPEHPWEGIIPNYFKMLLDFPPIWTSAVAVPKKVIIRLGGFPSGESFGEDLDLWFRIALEYKIAFTTQIKAIYNRDTTDYNFFCFRNKEIKIEPVLKTARYALKNQETPKEFLPYIQEYITRLQLGIASKHILKGNPDQARGVLNECITKRYFKEKWGLYFFSFLPSICLKQFYYCLKIKFRWE